MKPDRLVEPDAWVGHIPFAFWIVAALRPRVLVELGTHTGNSYAAFCQAVVNLNIDTTCYAVDTWLGDEQAGFYGEEVYEDLRRYHDDRYATFSRLVRARFDEALAHFDNGTIDLLHIDGCHTYKAIKHDFENWKPKLSPRGIILLHDINVRERDFGVWRLWGEISEGAPHFAFYHHHGLGVIGTGVDYPEEIRALFDARTKPERAGNVRRWFASAGRNSQSELEINRLRALLGPRDELETKLQQVAECRDEFNTDLRRLQEKGGLLEVELQEQRERLSELENEANRAATQRDEYHVELRRVIAQQEVIATELELAVRHRQELETTRQHAVSERDALNAEIARVLRDVDRLDGELQRAASDRVELEEELQRAHAEVEATQIQCRQQSELLGKYAADRRAQTEHTAQLERNLAKIKDSLSWRLTRWIRFAAAGFHQKKGPSVSTRALLAAAGDNALPTTYATSDGVGLVEQGARTASKTAVSRHTVSDFAMGVPFRYRSRPSLSDTPSVAAIVHIFYPELTEELCMYLSNIQTLSGIFVSTDTLAKQIIIEEYIRKWQIGPVEVRVMPNRGRDIAPKLVGFADVNNRFDYVVHLHTKKSPHLHDGRSWRQFIYEHLLGSPLIVENIIQSFQRHRTLGMIFPQHWTPLRECISWGDNFLMAQALAARLGLNLKSSMIPDYPSGSMFWARSAALAPLERLGLSFEDFPPENGQLDGALGHAVERLFTISCELAGYDWAKIAVRKLHDKQEGILDVASDADLDRFLAHRTRRLLAKCD